jgi:phosphate starvation-inducible PhoH-like protein
MAEKTMSVDRLEHIISVFGSFDENLRLIENELGVRITDRNSELYLTGEDENVQYAEHAINGLLSLAAKGENIDSRSVRYM